MQKAHGAGCHSVAAARIVGGKRASAEQSLQGELTAAGGGGAGYSAGSRCLGLRVRLTLRLRWPTRLELVLPRPLCALDNGVLPRRQAVVSLGGSAHLRQPPRAVQTHREVELRA